MKVGWSLSFSLRDVVAAMASIYCKKSIWHNLDHHFAQFGFTNMQHQRRKRKLIGKLEFTY